MATDLVPDLVSIRRAAGMTQAEVGRCMGELLGRDPPIAQTTVSGMERARFGPRLHMAAAYVRACGYRLAAVPLED